MGRRTFSLFVVVLFLLLTLAPLQRTYAAIIPSLGDVGPNVRVTADPNFRQQVEPTISIDPLNSSIIVAGAQDLRKIPEFGNRWHGYYRSTNDGKTWTNTLLPGFPTDTSPEGLASPLHGLATFTSDPVMAFDNLGNVYYTGVGVGCLSRVGLCTPADGIFVSKYTDHGAKYAFTTLINWAATSQAFSDKEWIAVDTTGGPFNGDVYVTWSICCIGTGNSEAIVFSRSTDGGLSYSSPSMISTAREDGIGAQVAITPNGHVYVSWVTYPQGNIYTTKSADGGQTFGPNVRAQTANLLPSPLPGNGFRTFTLPALAADNSGVYIAWDDFRTGDAEVLFTRSTDGGALWSQPVGVNDVTTNHQFFPAMAVSGGRISIIYFDSRNDPNAILLDVYYSQSVDGGTTFKPSLKITSQSFDPNIVPRTVNPGATSPFIGDYIGVAATPNEVHGLWPDNRDVNLNAGPNTGLYDQNVYTGTVANLSDGFRFDWSDYDNNGRVTILDISVAAAAFGKSNIYWDFNQDGVVTILEISIIAAYFSRSWGALPFPGQGQPAGNLDPSWKAVCTQFPQPDQSYCQSTP